MNQPTMHTCDVCGQVGKNGAMWLVIVNGDTSSPQRVHKPCGEAVVRQTPEGASAKLGPSAELRALWQEERNQRLAKGFWDSKFSEAQARNAARLERSRTAAV